MPHTIQLHRVLRTPAEILYKAFLDPDALVKWLPPHGFTGRMHSMEAKVGSGYRMSFTHLASGHSHHFSGTYDELTPSSCIRYHNAFDDPGLPGVMQVTIRLTPVSCGTEMHITQADVPDAIPAESCYLGWQQSLSLLAQLVENPG